VHKQSKLDEVTKSRDHLAELCAQSNYIRIIQGLESRLHQLSEDHSHCEDLLHELGARASSAESRLDAIRKLVTEPQPHVAGWETLEEIEKLVVETHAKGCTRNRPHSGPCDDGIGELTGAVERQAPFEEDWHTEIK
jgi:hypothetical protein